MSNNKPQDANLNADRFDVQVITRLTRIETKLESMPNLWMKVNDHEKAINRAKGAISVLGASWMFIVAVVIKLVWSHGKW